ncbi:hypothetical protein SAMN02745664_1246 [Moraxella cuniculi DSM 21768]|uniref:Uncharacterized protein n=1 Tax=Moraxella cuniculi DSM 21768 TaxID=1122245 RepID=A0A1N7G6J7_9GAMM|nr:hypothetical protein [Moraxella cuniculi]SIS08124.1 hypothetical protein SAMN02745664_1246 [Moraxella cuniculi DSM 21768]
MQSQTIDNIISQRFVHCVVQVHLIRKFWFDVFWLQRHAKSAKSGLYDCLKQFLNGKYRIIGLKK